MPEVPWSHVPVVDAVLRSIDPRLTEAERTRATAEAERRADFALGVLASVLMEYHRRAERVAGLPEGEMADRLRRKLIGDEEDATIGLALHDAASGEPVTVVMPVAGRPAQPAQANGDGRNPAGGTPVRGEAPGALSGPSPADERLARKAADLQGRIDQAQRRYAAQPMRGELNGDAARLAALADRLRAVRAEEEAGARLPDDEVAWLPTTPTVMTPEGLLPARSADVNVCGHATSRGPCELRPGHPAGPGLPGENGHIGGTQ